MIEGISRGFCLLVRDYKAQIVEFTTKSITTMPDNSKIYLIHTKFGDDYVNESELSPTKDRFINECEELNHSLSRLQNGGNNGVKARLCKPR